MKVLTALPCCLDSQGLPTLGVPPLHALRIPDNSLHMTTKRKVLQTQFGKAQAGP